MQQYKRNKKKGSRHLKKKEAQAIKNVIFQQVNITLLYAKIRQQMNATLQRRKQEAFPNHKRPHFNQVQKRGQS